MVHIPDSLAWELVKNNTSFMKKVNGQTKRSGSVKFSTERGNLPCLSMYKYSGLANSKAIDISPTDDNRAVLRTKTASKAHSYPKKGWAVTPLNKHYRRVEHIIKKQTIDNHYRPDLKRQALAKWSAVYRANRIAKGIKKPVPVKKGRQSAK